jgi:hypothetical protein
VPFLFRFLFRNNTIAIPRMEKISNPFIRCGLMQETRGTWFHFGTDRAGDGQHAGFAGFS